MSDGTALTPTRRDIIEPCDPAQNAVRHALYSDIAVAAGDERLSDWREFHAAVVLDLAPVGAAEAALASRAASLFWRLRRVVVAEGELIERTMSRAGPVEARNQRPQATDIDVEATGFYASAIRAMFATRTPDETAFAPINRREAHLNRQLLHTLHELEAFQARRHGKPAPLARIDIQGISTGEQARRGHT